jgi:hypothetical protein
LKPQIKHTNCLACKKIVYLLKTMITHTGNSFLNFLLSTDIGEPKWEKITSYIPVLPCT